MSGVNGAVKYGECYRCGGSLTADHKCGPINYGGFTLCKHQTISGACPHCEIEKLHVRNKELEAALSLAEALLQYEREKNTRAEKGEARKLTAGGREW